MVHGGGMVVWFGELVYKVGINTSQRVSAQHEAEGANFYLVTVCKLCSHTYLPGHTSFRVACGLGSVRFGWAS